MGVGRALGGRGLDGVGPGRGRGRVWGWGKSAGVPWGLEWAGAGVTQQPLAGFFFPESFHSTPFPFLAFLLISSPIIPKPGCLESGIPGSNPSSSVAFLAESP